MARQPRMEYEGAYYHVMSRGDHRQEIFRDEEDRRMFVELMGQVCARTGWRMHSWVLMERLSEITGLTGTALIIYVIVSEGLRLFPPRNLVPVP